MFISKEMYLFLKDYIKWIENGAIDGEPYCRKMGLCTNTVHFHFNTVWEFKALFESEGLDPHYPFGWTNYTTREQKSTQHKDSLRLQWIKDHIEKYETSLNKVNCGD